MASLPDDCFWQARINLTLHPAVPNCYPPQQKVSLPMPSDALFRFIFFLITKNAS